MANNNKDMGRRIQALESPTAIYPVGGRSASDYDGEFDPLSEEGSVEAPPPPEPVLEPESASRLNPLLAAGALLFGAVLALMVAVSIIVVYFFLQT